MSISLGIHLITGIMMGIEHVYADDTHHVVIDILFVRFLFEIES
jgi:hypothetical protein